MNTISARVFSSSSMGTRDDAVAFFRIMNELPDLTPSKCSDSEPIRGVYNPADSRSSCQYWGKSFLWKRRSVEGGVFASLPPYTDQHSLVFIYSKQATVVDPMIELLHRVCFRWNVDHGFVHSIMPQDIEIAEATDTISLSRSAENRVVMMSTHDLIRYIPDIYWANFYGKPYIQLFGRERLLSAPAAIVREIDNDCIYIQLTDDVTDLANNTEEVHRTRNAVKQHLGSNAFFSVDLPADHKYNVPVFDLPVRSTTPR